MNRRRATYQAPVRPDYSPGDQGSPLVAVAVTFLFFVSILAALVVALVVIR